MREGQFVIPSHHARAHRVQKETDKSAAKAGDASDDDDDDGRPMTGYDSQFVGTPHPDDQFPVCTYTFTPTPTRAQRNSPAWNHAVWLICMRSRRLFADGTLTAR